MKKLEYIYSPENLIRESTHFRFFKVFQFEYVTKKLKTKKSIRANESIDFQEKLIEAKKKQNKRVYRTEVVLEMDIYINQKNAPSIQNIPKCYIDLLWRPVDKFKNKNLILKDDDQIKYLKVNYKNSISEKSSIVIKIFPYKRLLKDIELLLRLESGIFKYDFKSIDLDDEFERDEESYKENDYFDELVNHLNDKENYIKTFGEEDFIFWEYFYKRQLQRTELNNQRIKNKQILNLFRKSIKIDSKILNYNYPVFDGLWDKLFDILGDFEVENLPTKSGEKEKFKKNIQIKMDEYFRKRWYYFPLLNPIGLTIFILPPKTYSKDFDNLAKWILPLYMEKLNPPTSFETSLQEIEKYRLKKHKKYSSLLPLQGDFPKNGIMSYQIIQIPPSKESPQNGYIKVNFHNTYFYHPFVDFLFNQIGKYEDKLE